MNQKQKQAADYVSAMKDAGVIDATTAETLIVEIKQGKISEQFQTARNVFLIRHITTAQLLSNLLLDQLEPLAVEPSMTGIRGKGTLETAMKAVKQISGKLFKLMPHGDADYLQISAIYEEFGQNLKTLTHKELVYIIALINQVKERGFESSTIELPDDIEQAAERFLQGHDIWNATIKARTGETHRVSELINKFFNSLQ